MKIENDKYYTPISTANDCIDKVIEKIGLENIMECIEPSIGDGSFTHHPKLRPTVGYDVDPELESDANLQIYTQDYLSLDANYKKGRLILGNPPFGEKLNLAIKFFKKSVDIGDYIAFILPISQYNNNNSMFEFDLVYSEDLGMLKYSDRTLHCCFNIYRRPVSGVLNKKPKLTTNAITIKRQDAKGYDDAPFDIRICYWGTIGKILKEDEHYSAEYKIVINNKEKYDEIYNFITSFDWRGYVTCVAMAKLQQFHIIRALKENIQDLEIINK